MSNGNVVDRKGLVVKKKRTGMRRISSRRGMDLYLLGRGADDKEVEDRE